MARRLGLTFTGCFPCNPTNDPGDGQLLHRSHIPADGTVGLDVNTLFLVTIYVEAMLGLLLLFAWIQNSGIHAVAWWDCAHLLRAGSVALFGMYGSVSDVISIDLANALLFPAFAVTWSGARVFDGRAPEPLYLVARAALWILVCRSPWLVDSLDAKVLLSSGIITAYTWATAYEILARPQRAAGLAVAGDLHAVRARCAVPAAHAIVQGAALVTKQSGVRQRMAYRAELRGDGVHHRHCVHPARHGEGMRTELRHKTATLVDPLTGIANRRSFLEEVVRLASARRRRAALLWWCSPISIISSRSTIASATPWATRQGSRATPPHAARGGFPARPSAARSSFSSSSLLLGGGFDLFLHSHQLAGQLLHCRFECGYFGPGGGEIAV